MRVEFNEKDMNFINGVNEDLANGEMPPLFVNEVGKTYYIKFTCADIAKANCFIFNLFSQNRDLEFENQLGISLESINYCHGDEKIGELKRTLQSFIGRLDQM